MIDTIARGREAVQRHAWTEAVESFTTADGQGRLAPADLELLGAALWWAGRPDEASEALQRAFSGHIDAGRNAMAAAGWRGLSTCSTASLNRRCTRGRWCSALSRR